MQLGLRVATETALLEEKSKRETPPLYEEAREKATADDFLFGTAPSMTPLQAHPPPSSGAYVMGRNCIFFPCVVARMCGLHVDIVLTSGDAHRVPLERVRKACPFNSNGRLYTCEAKENMEILDAELYDLFAHDIGCRKPLPHFAPPGTFVQVDFDDGESCGGVVRAMHYVEGVLHAVVAFADSDVYSLRVQQCRECLEFLSSS
tara:strand:+ start:4988 stop:5599 length:612 start_codon:yes stop_codon:yes gene_type:complete